MQPSACLHSGLKALLEKQKPVGLRDREEKMPAPSLRAGHSVEEKKAENSTTWTNCKNDFSESQRKSLCQAQVKDQGSAHFWSASGDEQSAAGVFAGRVLCIPR
jgi:hypothetical protein